MNVPQSTVRDTRRRKPRLRAAAGATIASTDVGVGVPG